MANGVNKEIAIVKSMGHPFQPYLIPNLAESPWLPCDNDHSSDRPHWDRYAKQDRRFAAPQEHIIQDFILYRVRFSSQLICEGGGVFSGVSGRIFLTSPPRAARASPNPLARP